MSTRLRPQWEMKKSAFSCDKCRTRKLRERKPYRRNAYAHFSKVRCGGQRPSCTRCVARGDTCEYKLNPTLSYTERLEAKIVELEARLLRQDSRLQIDASSSVVHFTKEYDCENHPPPSSFDGLSADHTGKISFHGPTSIFNFPFQRNRNEGDKILDAHDAQETRVEQWREHLVTNAWVQRAAEPLSTEAPFNFLLQRLLDFHWTWIQPLFNFVYRPAFTRDMKVFGPYYSHTLLSAVLAHSARWCHVDANMREALEPYDSGRLFACHAQTLLHEDLQQGRCDIPTIQALLLISAQECGRGNWTLAWMYSGIAFRLAEDLGITVDGLKYPGSVTFSEEDIEIRNRLFWSCYIWDKMISLYMGRTPAIQHSNVSPPQIMMDDSTEYEPWNPLGISINDQHDSVPFQSYAVSTFTWACRLVQILERLLVEVYNPLKLDSTQDSQVQNCIRRQRVALQQWWELLPDVLRLRPQKLPVRCPPSHIVTLNCLYHITNVLLHRPLLADSSAPTHPPQDEALDICVSSASAIWAIFSLFSRSFGFGHCIMALSYALYTATSIFLIDVQKRNYCSPERLREIQDCMFALRNVIVVNPVLDKALRLLYIQFTKLGLDTEATENSHFKRFATELPSQQESTNPIDFTMLPVTLPMLEVSSEQS